MSKHNAHHTLWTKRQYLNTYEPLMLRQSPTMIHLLDAEEHQALHREIDPIKTITPNLARVALQTIHDQPLYLPRLEKFYGVIERFDQVSKGIGRTAIEAGLFANHLAAQLAYFGRFEDGTRTVHD